MNTGQYKNISVTDNPPPVLTAMIGRYVPTNGRGRAEKPKDQPIVLPLMFYSFKSRAAPFSSESEIGGGS